MTGMGRQLLGAILTAAVLHGCGRTEPVVEERAALDEAVEQYLRRNSMDLAIVAYREFELDESGDEATAVIALKHADETYGNLQVRFQFEFAKQDERWEVTGHHKAK